MGTVFIFLEEIESYTNEIQYFRKRITSNLLSNKTRQLKFIPHFTFNIRHIKGQKNELPDALSRTMINTLIPSGIDYHDLAKLQETDVEFSKLRSDDAT